MLVGLSCKKEKLDPSLSGKIKSSTTGLAISGATVQLYKREVMPGVVSNINTLIGTKTTDALGNFSFDVERGTIQQFQIDASHSLHQEGSFVINPDDVLNQNDFYQEFAIEPRLWIKTQVTNIGAMSPTDQLRFRFVNAAFGCECCASDEHIFTGANVDTMLVCELPSSFDLQYIYEAYQDGYQISSESAFVSSVPADTALVEINY